MITMGSPYFVWINANEIISSWYLLGAVCAAPPCPGPGSKDGPAHKMDDAAVRRAVARKAGAIKARPELRWRLSGKALAKALEGPKAREKEFDEGGESGDGGDAAAAVADDLRVTLRQASNRRRCHSDAPDHISFVILRTNYSQRARPDDSTAHGCTTLGAVGGVDGPPPLPEPLRRGGAREPALRRRRRHSGRYLITKCASRVLLLCVVVRRRGTAPERPRAQRREGRTQRTQSRIMQVIVFRRARAGTAFGSRRTSGAGSRQPRTVRPFFFRGCSAFAPARG
jgi:hypothetical protein